MKFSSQIQAPGWQVLERWGKTIRARRFYPMLTSARLCLAVKPGFGVGSGIRYLETRSCRFGTGAQNHREARTRDLIYLRGGLLNDRRQPFTTSIYALCDAFVEGQTRHSSKFFVSTMHCSTTSILGALFTANLFQSFVNGQQLSGSILHSGVEGDGIVWLTVENNSTNNYAIEARNNLFDTNSPYQPMNVTNLAGAEIQLVGAEYPYGLLTDASFVQMPAGAIWQRELNITSYMPADSTITKPTARCYYVTFPDGFWAIDTTNMQSGEDLATQFLTPGANRLVDLYIVSNILHLNVTSMPASAASLAATTVQIPEQPAATEFVGSHTIGLASSETDGTSIDEYDSVLGG